MAPLAERVQDLAQVLADLDVPVLQVVCRSGSMSFIAFDSSGERTSAHGGFELSDALQALEQDLRPAGEHRPLTIELRRAANIEFLHTFELHSMSPTQVILDPTYRHRNHPLPGMPAPAGIAVTNRRTDPAVLATLQGLVNEYVAAYTSIKGRTPDFGTGYSEEELVAAETAIGMRLPEDVRALYRIVHDDMSGHGLLGVQALMPLEAVVSAYLEGDVGSYGWMDDMFDGDPVVFDAYPYGRVRRLSRSDWWVTIASDRSGDWCAVDLDPAPLGTPGQVIAYGRNVIGPVGYVAESVTAILRQVVAAVRGGGYQDNDPDSSHLPLTERVGAAPPAPYCQFHQLRDRSVAALVADFDAPLDLQEFFLNDGDTLDLAQLAPLRNLRVVSVNRAKAVEVALPRDLPIESLHVNAVAANLAPLAGHPTLWKVTLKGLADPLTIAPLMSLPALTYLDLSAVEVTDLERVAALPQLRVLALNPRQWRHLRELDAAPTGLAGAMLSGQLSLADALDWAAWVR